MALMGPARSATARPTRGPCPPGSRRCPGSRGACVDMQTDPNNCGACGNDCSRCHSCGGECCAGVCGLCFAAGQICCQGSYCVNPFTDPENWGGCVAAEAEFTAEAAATENQREFSKFTATLEAGWAGINSWAHNSHTPSKLDRY